MWVRTQAGGTLSQIPSITGFARASQQVVVLWGWQNGQHHPPLPWTPLRWVLELSTAPTMYPGGLIPDGMLGELETNVAQGSEWNRGDGARRPQGSELWKLMFSGVTFLIVVLPMESPRLWCFTDPVPGPRGCGQEPSCARAGPGYLCRPTALLYSAFPPTHTEGEREVVKLSIQWWVWHLAKALSAPSLSKSQCLHLPQLKAGSKMVLSEGSKLLCATKDQDLL